MSKETTRTVRVKAIDETTPVLLGIARTMRSVSREIHFLMMFLRMLKEAQDAAARSAMTLGAAVQLAIPGIGIIASLISIFAAIKLTEERAIIPVGQTLPGQIRPITATGPILAHAGEVIGRPERGGFGGEGGGSIIIENVNMRPDGDSPEAIGRQFRQMRMALSTDIPMT